MMMSPLQRLPRLCVHSLRNVLYSKFLNFNNGGWCCYHNAPKVAVSSSENVHVIDFRSDTLTKPDPKMREAMANAEVGDDVYGEDPTINELQKKCAALFGKEDALFVPTGTMGNLISVMTHCQERGLEAILGSKSHIFIHEQGGIAQVAGVLTSIIENKPDGTLDIDKIRERIRLSDDPHFPYTRLICLENTQNMCGGKVLPISYMQDVYGLANELGLKVHLDGARLMNAATALNVPPSEILKYADSVSMCFSKGLACPVGSILAGTKPFIKQARRTRKVLGGGLRQAGVLAAAALYSIDNIIPKLQEDHQHAQMLAKGIMSNHKDVININISGVHTNIMFVELVKDGLNAAQFNARLSQVPDEERQALGYSIVVKLVQYSNKLVRMVLHTDISTEDVNKAIQKINYVIDEISQQ